MQPRLTKATLATPSVSTAAYQAGPPPPPAGAAPLQGMPAPQVPLFEVDTWLGTGFDVYKGRSAVQFKPIVASFKESAPGTYVLDRKGVLLLECANSVGNRQYDWQTKVSFALSVTEMAELFLVPDAIAAGVSMFHDPNMNSNAQGQVRGHTRASAVLCCSCCVLAPPAANARTAYRSGTNVWHATPEQCFG